MVYGNILARPERFELPTTWFVARYSIQLSYGRVERRDYSLNSSPIGEAKVQPQIGEHRERRFTRTGTSPNAVGRPAPATGTRPAAGAGGDRGRSRQPQSARSRE